MKIKHLFETPSIGHPYGGGSSSDRTYPLTQPHYAYPESDEESSDILYIRKALHSHILADDDLLQSIIMAPDLDSATRITTRIARSLPQAKKVHKEYLETAAEQFARNYWTANY